MARRRRRRGGDVALLDRHRRPRRPRAGALGDSIAVNGVCLTVVGVAPGRVRGRRLARDAGAARRSGGSRPARASTSSRRCAPGEPLGGHFVTGHVDGVGDVARRAATTRGSLRAEFEVPGGARALRRAKGSVCVDGVSLTVNGVAGDRVRRQPRAAHAGGTILRRSARHRAGQPRGRPRRPVPGAPAGRRDRLTGRRLAAPSQPDRAESSN